MQRLSASEVSCTRYTLRSPRLRTILCIIHLTLSIILSIWSPACRMLYSKWKDENTYDSDYECMAKKQEKNKTVQNDIREPKRSI